jgi:hypothetical protein
LRASAGQDLRPHVGEDAAVGIGRKEPGGNGLAATYEPQLVVARGLTREALAEEERATARIEDDDPRALGQRTVCIGRGLEGDQLGPRLDQQLERVLLPERVDSQVGELTGALGGR